MIRSKISTRSTYKGIDPTKFREQLKRYKNAYVSVGVHEGAGSYESGVTVAEVALWNEFGTRNIPERSWMRSTLDAKVRLINKWRKEAVENICTGKWTIAKALEVMGFRIQVLLQNAIKSNIPPPYGTGKRIEGPLQEAALSAHEDKVTKAQDAKQKRGLAPVTLIESGLMLRSVTFQVHLDGGGKK